MVCSLYVSHTTHGICFVSGSSELPRVPLPPMHCFTRKGALALAMIRPDEEGRGTRLAVLVWGRNPISTLESMQPRSGMAGFRDKKVVSN